MLTRRVPTTCLDRAQCDGGLRLTNRARRPGGLLRRLAPLTLQRRRRMPHRWRTCLMSPRHRSTTTTVVATLDMPALAGRRRRCERLLDARVRRLLQPEPRVCGATGRNAVQQDGLRQSDGSCDWNRPAPLDRRRCASGLLSSYSFIYPGAERAALPGARSGDATRKPGPRWSTAPVHRRVWWNRAKATSGGPLPGSEMQACSTGNCSGTLTTVAQDAAGSVVTDGAYAYWSTATQLKRCPLGPFGCNAPPTVVVPGGAGESGLGFHRSELQRFRRGRREHLLASVECDRALCEARLRVTDCAEADAGLRGAMHRERRGERLLEWFGRARSMPRERMRASHDPLLVARGWLRRELLRPG